MPVIGISVSRLHELLRSEVSEDRVEQLLDWLGPKAWVSALDFRFKNLVFAGETVRCSATVTGVETEGDRLIVTVASQVEVAGDKARVAAAPCNATVVVRP